ncbi:hypothetical protein BpHYR1_035948 [Brachionus plicatilis]|uniref:Uncharacterized protein n=1 Tax=Brachionus plicatilis TaxID=10195 RepID=A0A3M7QSI5_BRAPC|nr:hypothetical protein BpHYR1_035948 [Brachionus plicatilis]
MSWKLTFPSTDKTYSGCRGFLRIDGLLTLACKFLLAHYSGCPSRASCHRFANLSGAFLQFLTR